jgi:hypothetical protein
MGINTHLSSDPNEIAAVSALRTIWEANPKDTEAAFNFDRAWYLFSQEGWTFGRCTFAVCDKQAKGLCPEHYGLVNPSPYGDIDPRGNSTYEAIRAIKARNERFRVLMKSMGVTVRTI